MSYEIRDVLDRAKDLKIDAWAHMIWNAPGDHRSRFLGEGVEFSDVREYVAGDDPRRIDWNVSARYGGLYIKEFVEERDLSVYVMIDRSDSTAFGSVKSKQEIMTDIGTSLILSALHNNNSRIGLGIFAESLERFVPAKKGKGHAMRIVREAIKEDRDKHRKGGRGHASTNLARSVLQLADRIRHKSTVFIISDFITKPFSKELRHLSAKHAVVMIHVSDAHEAVMPDIGYAYLEDMETGKQVLVDTSSDDFQEAYKRASRKADESIKAQADKAGASYVKIAKAESFADTFNRHAMMMMMRTAARTRDRAGGIRSSAV